MSSQIEAVNAHAAGLLAEQAVRTVSGRKLLVAAVRDLIQRGLDQRSVIREIGTQICQLTNAHTLREIASDIAADGEESSLVAHDEMLNGFWHS